MENFAPGLRESVLGLTEGLRIVVYFVCVVGLIMQVQQARTDIEGLARPVVRAIIVVGLVATLPHWFRFTERVFLSVADTLHQGYTEQPMRAAAKLRDTVGGSASEFSLRRIGESMYQAFLHATTKFVVLVASILQVPFLALQFILKLLCYLFLPVALAFFMVPSQARLATRYVQQTLAVLAWPVGFALTELVAYHLLTAYAHNLAAAYELTPGDIDAASFGSLLGGLLGALWLILGTVATPFLMQALICQGSPVSGGGSTALQQIYAVQQLAWLVKTLKTGGAAAPVLAAALAKGNSQGGGGSGLPPPMPPPPSTSPAAPAPADPSGDARAAQALALTQLPGPQRSL